VKEVSGGMTAAVADTWRRKLGLPAGAESATAAKVGRCRLVVSNPR